MSDDCTVIAIAKNEGLFLVEWIAHHLAIGFDHIVVATNDCEDGSDRLLDAISDEFPVVHLDNSKAVKGLTIQKRGNLLCLNHNIVQNSRWALNIDIDEFLNITSDSGQIRDFLDQRRDADAVALLWKLFGDNARKHWDGGFVTDAFWSCDARWRDNQGHKTIFRPAAFQDLTPHMPKAPRKKPDELIVVNSRGDRLSVDRHYSERGTAYDIDPSLLTWENACINHYMVKSHDLSRLKLHRGDANNRRNRKRMPGTGAFEFYNRNEAQDYTIQASRAKRLEIYHAMMAKPEIAHLHLNCLEWFFSKRRLEST